MNPNSTYEKNIREMLAIGDMMGESALAGKIAKRGGNIRDFYKALLDRDELPSAESLLGLTARDINSYSLTKLIQAQAEGHMSQARHERDLSALITDKTGVVPRGEYVPFSVLGKRDFNAGTAGEAGNTIGSDRLGKLAGDPIRKVFTLAQLGATFFTGLKATAAVPVFESSTAAAYLTEIGSATSVIESTRLVTLAPRRVSVTFVMSRQAVIQATPELDDAIERQMKTAIDEAVLRGVLVGDGSGQNPTGILNNTDVNIIAGGDNGATLAFSHLVDMDDAPLADDIASGTRGWVINSATRKYLRTKAKGAGLPYILGDDNQILGNPVLTNNLMPANLTKGSGSSLNGLLYSNRWEELLVGIYGGGFDVTVDRVTLADRGQLRVVVALEFGFGLREPKAFAVMKDAALV